jgi:hypothetical protein
MSIIHPVVALTVLLGLSGCMTSMAAPDAPTTETAEATGATVAGTGATRIAAAGTHSGEGCLKTCGLAARSGVYTDCMSTDSTKEACRTEARTWYLDCIEDECTAEEVQLDTCRTECRTAGGTAKGACGPDAADSETCVAAARETTRTCVASCRVTPE